MIIDCCVTQITDRRKDINKKYSLESLVLLIFSAVISGYESIEDIILFGELKQAWLNKFVSLSSIPSRETLRYFLCTINPDELVPHIPHTGRLVFKYNNTQMPHLIIQ